MNKSKENFFTKDINIKRALISVTDKRDLEKIAKVLVKNKIEILSTCLLYTSPSPRDVEESRMPSSA